MCHLFVRLLVALLTFAVGVALSALWGAFSSPRVKRTETTTAVFVAPRDFKAPAPRVYVHEMRPQIVDGGILNGKAISKPAPEYPAIAKAGQVRGTVVVKVIVDESGQVVWAEALKGHPLLREAAVTAAQGARFAPTRLSGEPARVTGTLSYNFVPK